MTMVLTMIAALEFVIICVFLTGFLIMKRNLHSIIKKAELIAKRNVDVCAQPRAINLTGGNPV